jgi:uncharacterized protein YjbI with pentapeptide repeats
MDNTMLQHAVLRDARLCFTDLRYADLTGAVLVRANLCGAILSEANLEHASLDGACLEDAALGNVNGIDWASCGWTDHGAYGGMITGAVIDGESRYFFAGFAGTESDFERIIAEAFCPESRESRLVALEFVAARLAEMQGRR